MKFVIYVMAFVIGFLGYELYSGRSERSAEDIYAAKEIKFFKASVFSRDNNTCQGCSKRFDGGTETFLKAHLITPSSEMLTTGYVIENGISLCKATCLKKAQEYYVSNKTRWYDNFLPEALYKRIKENKKD